MRTRIDPEIAPDEIFLDATNTPSFDQGRFEGRLERPLGHTVYLFMGGVLVLALLTIVSQSLNLQILQGSAYAAQSERNSLSTHAILARRGVVMDTNGVLLVQNKENTESSSRVVDRVYRVPGYGALLGYVSYPKKDSQGYYYETDITGIAGIEAQFNEHLAGVGGTILVERNALGEVQSEGVVNPPVPGNDLRLTIDARAQEEFFEVIREVADRMPYLGGAGVLMEVDTGAVRALVSYPEFDPNVLSSGGPTETIAAYNTSKRKPYLDRAIAGLYAPGSIVKPLGAVGALTDGVLTPEITVNSTGSISVPNPYDPDRPSIFKDWRALGVVDMRDAIAWSSDIYFYMLGGGYGGQRGLGIERLADWYRAFGLERTTGIELSGESAGFVPTPKWKEEEYNEPWRIGDTYHTAIGQYAMQVTPIAMARAFAAIANNGKLISPTLVEGTPVVGETLAVSPEALTVAREGMRQAVTEGTARGLFALDPVVRTAAKTGTAQAGVRNEFYNSWIVGFFPYENPKYVFVVVMERAPAGTTTGGVYVMNQFLSRLAKVAPEYFE